MDETIQFMILTGMKARHSEGFWSVNPFYKASKEEISNNFEEAKKVYKDVFAMFTSTYVIHKSKELGIIPDGSLESLQEGEHEILKALEHHDIPPMPFYNELRELKI